MTRDFDNPRPKHRERYKQRVETTPETARIISITTLTIHDWFTLAPTYRTRAKLVDMISDALIEADIK